MGPKAHLHDRDLVTQTLIPGSVVCPLMLIWGGGWPQVKQEGWGSDIGTFHRSGGEASMWQHFIGALIPGSPWKSPELTGLEDIDGREAHAGLLG